MYVGNLGDGATDNMLREAFGQYGEVLYAVVLTEPATGMVRAAQTVLNFSPASCLQFILESFRVFLRVVLMVLQHVLRTIRVGDMARFCMPLC